MLPIAAGDVATWGDEAAMAEDHGHQPDAMLPPFRLQRREELDWLPFSQKKRSPVDGGRNHLAETRTVASPQGRPLMSSTVMRTPVAGLARGCPSPAFGDLDWREGIEEGGEEPVKKGGPGGGKGVEGEGKGPRRRSRNGGHGGAAVEQPKEKYLWRLGRKGPWSVAVRRYAASAGRPAYAVFIFFISVGGCICI